MSKFVLEPPKDIYGHIKFFKLIEDSVCYWNVFCEQIDSEGNWGDQIDLLKSRMDEVSSGHLMPYKKFHKLDPPKTDEYEVKTDGGLRVYLLLNSGEYIIMYAGKKNEQTKNLRTFRAIKKRYLAARPDDITRKTT
jgi:hypothetical protein